MKSAQKQGVQIPNPFMQNPQMRNLEQQARERFEQANIGNDF